MTDQLRAAIDQLNACTTADEVAALLRRHGVRAEPIENGARCSSCPIAVYLKSFGGAKDVRVYPFGTIIADGFSQLLRFAIGAFIAAADRGDYRDLEAA